MKKFGIPSLVAVLASVALMLAGCGSSAGGSSGAVSGKSGIKGAKITVLTVTQSVPYIATATEALKKDLEDAGADVTVVINEFDAARQAQQVTQAISTRPDGVIVWPSDASAIIPSLTQLKNAKIPTVVWNSQANTKDESLFTAYSGPNDAGYGEAAARQMVEALAAKNITQGGIIEITGVPGTNPAIKKDEAFRETLAKLAPGLKVVGSQPGNWDQTQATSATAALLTEHPDVVGIFGQIDPMAVGAITAASRAGIEPSSITIVGSLCSSEGIAAIEKGDLAATAIQSPKDDAALAAKVMGQILAGESVKKYNYMQIVPITKDNVAQCPR